MAEVRNRLNNPGPQLSFEEIYIPDGNDFGSGAFRFVVKRKALTPPKIPVPKAITAMAIYPPRFQISVTVNPGTGEIPVLLGRADGTDPLSRGIFLLPLVFDRDEPHEFKATFIHWHVISLFMDGKRLQLVKVLDSVQGRARSSKASDGGRHLKDSKPSFGSIAQEIVGMYRALLNERAFTIVKSSSNVIGCRLRLMSNIIDGNITPNTIKLEKAISFHEALLDAIALQYATGERKSVFDGLKTGAPSILGRSHYRRSQLTASTESQLDWHFQLLVQAQASAKGFGPIKDLQRDPRFRGKPVCDFALAGDRDQLELLECKRIHPAGHGFTYPISMIIAKLLDRLPEAGKQLNETAGVLGYESVCRHLLIDISAYCDEPREVQSVIGPIQLIGFSRDQVDHLHREVSSYCFETNGMADKLTLCWRTLVLIEGKVRAIIHNTRTATANSVVKSIFNYQGWTVEGYPLFNSEYGHLRIASEARSLDWILESYIQTSRDVWKKEWVKDQAP